MQATQLTVHVQVCAHGPVGRVGHHTGADGGQARHSSLTLMDKHNTGDTFSQTHSSGLGRPRPVCLCLASLPLSL